MGNLPKNLMTDEDIKNINKQLSKERSPNTGLRLTDAQIAMKENERLKKRIEKLEQRQEVGQHDTLVTGTKWTNVEDEPLADITIERDKSSVTVTYDNYLVGVDMLFAVPLGNGKYSICRGYIEDDGSIQESFQSRENEWWGYSLEDVTHYMQIFNPK